MPASSAAGALPPASGLQVVGFLSGQLQPAMAPAARLPLLELLTEQLRMHLPPQHWPRAVPSADTLAVTPPLEALLNGVVAVARDLWPSRDLAGIPAAAMVADVGMLRVCHAALRAEAACWETLAEPVGRLPRQWRLLQQLLRHTAALPPAVPPAAALRRLTVLLPTVLRQNRLHNGPLRPALTMAHAAVTAVAPAQAAYGGSAAALLRLVRTIDPAERFCSDACETAEGCVACRGTAHARRAQPPAPPAPFWNDRPVSARAGPKVAVAADGGQRAPLPVAAASEAEAAVRDALRVQWQPFHASHTVEGAAAASKTVAGAARNDDEAAEAVAEEVGSPAEIQPPSPSPPSPTRLRPLHKRGRHGD